MCMLSSTPYFQVKPVPVPVTVVGDVHGQAAQWRLLLPSAGEHSDKLIIKSFQSSIHDLGLFREHVARVPLAFAQDLNESPQALKTMGYAACARFFGFAILVCHVT